MDKKLLEQQIATMKESLFNEEILNDMFTTVEETEDADNPNFIVTIANLYLSETPKNIDALEQTLEANPFDFLNLERCLVKLRGSSVSFGANKVTNEVDKILYGCTIGDAEGCKAGFPNLKQEFDTLKKNLEPYLELLQQYKSSTPSSGPNEDMVDKNK
ncbi:pseudo histidine-containing phosphotransfer protein 2-like [Corylus avellana]|uniref:pseudo histidine-containing phosphotransfer protein 2-like n=1 Tax=Corylus avellana TaxID=13451 RepID=UPI00286B9559|nr:pseudo histidine-containing phosphotransfer protein 2-like [Corylus avellana]